MDKPLQGKGSNLSNLGKQVGQIALFCPEGWTDDPSEPCVTTHPMRCVTRDHTSPRTDSVPGDLR
jgi:hypothetical protein